MPLPGWYGERRKDLLALLDRLEERIAPLNKAVSQAAANNAEACLLMTHPGVGPVVSLAYVLTIGNWQRFARGKQVGSYLGLIPSEDSSSDKRRLGHISKQGNTLLRWLLVEAASDGAEVRSELASAVSAPVDEQASRRGQGGYRPQAGGSFVLDVALRGRLSARQGARFSREAVRVPRWSLHAAD